MAALAHATIDPAQAFSGALWFDVILRSAAFPQLLETVLLHAGPPLLSTPPLPIRNSAVQALLFEGQAKDEAEALRLLASGAVQLQPAQDYGIATPLAQVVSASMGLVAVQHHAQVRFAPLLEGAPPALRFGSREASCRERLHAIGRLVTERVRPVLRVTPVPLDAVIREAVAAGDDCHSRTATANQALLRRLCDVPDGNGLDAETAAALSAMPAFVLPILMAAALAALAHHACPIEALGGNGVDFGVRRRGAAAWDRLAALPPTGQRLPGREASVALPAIGDSVLVDFCGLGGQLDHAAVRDALRDPMSGILDPARIAAAATQVPFFNLAILDAAGEAGLIGRGTYRPPAELFHAAA